jgi:protein gp37
MAKQSGSGISWTDATWNPVVGCTRVSSGCQNCWAERQARLHYHDEFPTGWNGNVKIFTDRMWKPLHMKKPRKIAVGLMGDLFHKNVPAAFIGMVFQSMKQAHWHTFQLLTKRADRMMEFCSKIQPDPLPNVWLGVSCENQDTADERIPILLQTPALIRFASFEPLLGPIKLTRHHAWCPTHDFSGGFCTGACQDRRYLDWAICGGESGPGARPMHPEWPRNIKDQCVSSGVPFHFKQWGEWAPATAEYGTIGSIMPETGEKYTWIGCNGRTQNPSFHGLTGAMAVAKIGKKAAGRMLDGREWLEFPGKTQ